MSKTIVRLFLMTLALVSLSSLALAQERIVVALGVDATNLDAPKATDSPTATILSHIVQPLFEFTPEGTIEPLLVESYEFSKDGLSLTLNLREGITFQDDTPFNAEAVKFNLERFVAPETAAPFAFLLANRWTDIVVEDEHTVRIDLAGPFAPLLAHLTHSSTAIQSPTAIQQQGEDYANPPVGTGPYRFVAWEPGQYLDLTRFDGYWGERPEIENVRFLPVPENTTRMALVETGEAHVAVNVPPQDMARLAANPDVAVDISTGLRTIYIFFNTQREPFTDARVRRALNYAVDKEQIVDFLLGGAARPSDAAIAPNIFGYSPAGTYEYDPERARELLAEAGYEDGLDLTLHCPSGRYPQDIQICEAIQSMLADVDVNATIETMEWGAYLQTVRAPFEDNQVQMGMLGWGTVTGDADYGLYALFHSDEWAPAFNLAFYRNSMVDSLLEEARTNTDPAVREQVYADILELIYTDAPWLFLHSLSQVTAIRDEVEGVIVHPTERFLVHKARFR